MCGRVLLAALLLSSILLSASGQQPSPQLPPAQATPTASQQKPTPIDDQDVVHINTNLVQVDAVVTKDGRPVTDLNAEDFEIFEDGRRQIITNFSYISNLRSNLAPTTGQSARKEKNTLTAPTLIRPAVINSQIPRRTVVLMIDDLGLTFESIARVRMAAEKFLDERSPEDLVAIIRTGGEVGALQQFTTDRRLLQSAVNHLRWNPCSRVGLFVQSPERPGAGGPGETSRCSDPANQGNTLATIRFVLEGMRDLPGRKSMIILSDNLPIEQLEAARTAFSPQSGTPNEPSRGLVSYGSQLKRVSELAIRASVVIYAVDTQGLQTTGITAADEMPNPKPNTPPDANPYSSLIRNRSRALLTAREGAAMS